MLSGLREMSARQGDVALAIGLSAVLVVELQTGQSITGSWAVNYPFGLLVTGALAWRRPWPVWVVVVQLVALIGQTALGGDLIDNSFATFFSLLLAFYAVGAYAPDPWSTRALGFGLVGVVIVDLVGGNTGFGDFAFPVLLL